MHWAFRQPLTKHAQGKLGNLRSRKRDKDTEWEWKLGDFLAPSNSNDIEEAGEANIIEEAGEANNREEKLEGTTAQDGEEKGVEWEKELAAINGANKHRCKFCAD
jgi:hypothetical protein